MRAQRPAPTGHDVLARQSKVAQIVAMTPTTSGTIRAALRDIGEAQIDVAV
jgi:hypothetical protein